MQLIQSIPEFHRLTGLPEPMHPLVSVVHVADMQLRDAAFAGQFALDFYCISLKRDVLGKVKYGQHYYDYDKGLMTFIGPKQVQSLDVPHGQALGPEAGNGFALLVHRDFLYKHPLATSIRTMGFFSYAVNEALHLSQKEEANVTEIFRKIQEEYQHIDKHTQEIILAQLEVLLSYSQRFYERQFITRKAVNHDLLTRMDQALDRWLEQQQGAPTVELLARELNLTPHYLGDMLRSLTGRNAQQHIQDKMMEKAKEYLSGTSLTVAEIAYQLGFEYPQSFNKFFRRNMNVSPLEFRQSFN
ncbi:MAG: AraC family transcriptional regulator [Chitinophagaceae bacterium]|nr:MAG: AraC family transcriptional regulator [Chitinophagaceae bacterium]